jgi:hypothetical protein
MIKAMIRIGKIFVLIWILRSYKFFCGGSIELRLCEFTEQKNSFANTCFIWYSFYTYVEV